MMKKPPIKNFKWKFTKAILKFIGLSLFRASQFFIALIFFPIAFPFRKKAYEFTKEHGSRGLHILQITNWFFTKDNNNGDYYVGPYWYQKEWKDKVFTKYTNETKEDPIAETFKQKLVYFILAYKWGVFRNFMWNLKRILFNEGTAIGYYDNDDKIFLSINNMVVQNIGKLQMAQMKFIDNSNTYRDNKGPVILYPHQGFPPYMCTLEGGKLIFFRTPKTNEKDIVFSYRTVKIFKCELIERFIGIEFYCGWDLVYGDICWHSKFAFIKFTNENLKNYDKYKKEFKL